MVFIDNTCNGKCSNCASCCGSILPLTEKDIKRISYIIKSKKIKPSRPKVILAKDIDLVCPFLTNEKKCSIYKHRPAICKYFYCNKAGREKPSQEEINETMGARPFNMRDFWDE